jgi:hypothetical protein
MYTYICICVYLYAYITIIKALGEKFQEATDEKAAVEEQAAAGKNR